MLGVPRRDAGRRDGAAAAGVHAPVPRGVHRPVAGRALDVPDLPLGRRPDDGRRSATSRLIFFPARGLRTDYGEDLVSVHVAMLPFFYRRATLPVHFF